MSVIENNIYRPSIQIRNERKYIAPCDLVYVTDEVSATDSYTLTREYVPESRPKPIDLTRNLTSREKVYERNGKRGTYYYEYSDECAHGSHKYVHKSHTVGVFPHFSEVGWDYANLKAQNLWAIKIRQKIRAYQVNLGSSLAEYRESAKMFVNAAHGLHDAWKVLRGRMPRRKIRACSIPASVLQFNFGVAPLVGDLYSSIETLRLAMDRPITRRLSVGVKKPIQASDNIGNWHYYNKGSFSQRATVYFTVNPNQTLSSDFDFGNPAEWAWELIPFSFVVDWAIPIGDWLGTIDSLAGIDDLRGTLTTVTAEGGSYYPSNATHVVTPGSFSARSYEREVITSVPMPPFPDFKPSLSGRRIVNAVSLLGTISKPCRRGR